jgi:DNA invertase Pin-like site-specific DNA recombinase
MRNTNGKRNRSSSNMDVDNYIEPKDDLSMEIEIDETTKNKLTTNAPSNKKFKPSKSSELSEISDMSDLSTDSIESLCNVLTNNKIKKDQAIIYCRVSTKNQTFGTSLESQKSFCQEYCSKNNLTIISVVNEINSAKNMDKQVELNDLLELKENFILVVYKPSRLSRNLKDFVHFNEKCKQKNVTIQFVQDNLDSSVNSDFKKIISGVIDGQTESINLGLRVKRSISFRKLTGNYQPSVAPYGYKYSKEKTMRGYKSVSRVNLQEKNIIDLINKLYWGSNIEYINSLFIRITGKPQELYFVGEPDKPIDKIEYGNMRMNDIANFLNSIPILRRNREWTGTSISQVLNKNLDKRTMEIDC